MMFAIFIGFAVVSIIAQTYITRPWFSYNVDRMFAKLFFNKVPSTKPIKSYDRTAFAAWTTKPGSISFSQSQKYPVSHNYLYDLYL